MIKYSLSKSPWFATATALGLFALAASSGCGGDSAGRVAVWGNVTWKGQPVPAGVIYFNPDTKQDNSGPQGFALIKEGRFDSRDKSSKGCVTGPLIAVVHGCTGEGKSSDLPYGRPLFSPVEMPLDVPAEGGEIDLIVPDTVKAIAPGTNEPE